MSYSRKYQELKEEFDELVADNQLLEYKKPFLMEIQEKARAMIPETLDMNIRTNLANLCIECDHQMKVLDEVLK